MAGGEKTEKATSKKRSDERKKGNIFMSKDVITVASLFIMFYSLKFLFPGIYTNIKEFLLRHISYAGTVTSLSESFLKDLTIGFIIAIAKIAVPLLLISMLVAIVATEAQTKGLFVTSNLKPKFSKLNPINGLKKMFSLKSLIEILKGLVKITILFVIIYIYFKSELVEFPRTLHMDLVSSVIFLLDRVMNLVIYVSMAFVAISMFDYMYQRWEYERSIRMSKEDIKEEYKQMEGDPKIKAKIKENQRKLAMSRMMQAVPSADVVVRNPTHYAIALRYDIEKDIAPIVIAKGQDEVALRIVEVAEENHVTVLENKPLARALYATTEINGVIPMEYYGTIAELLVYVYRLNGKEL